MGLRRRIERAKDTARFAAKVAGTLAVVAVLGVLWAALHEAERESLLARTGAGGP